MSEFIVRLVHARRAEWWFAPFFFVLMTIVGTIGIISFWTFNSIASQGGPYDGESVSLWEFVACVWLFLGGIVAVIGAIVLLILVVISISDWAKHATRRPL